MFERCLILLHNMSSFYCLSDLQYRCCCTEGPCRSENFSWKRLLFGHRRGTMQNLANVNCIKMLHEVFNVMLYAVTDVLIETPVHIKRYWCGSMSKNQGICSSVCKSVLENENPRAARFHSIWVQTRNVIQLGRFKKVYKNRWISGVPRLASTLPAWKWPSVGKRRGPTKTCTIIVC